ncbi:DcaP family trimeric outer membrane transporter [uncultured Bacteroides sp.]|uniref:DcaP family trimeric outer membrane transporter n=1 Tax=uncultured Bacteroides sp. TaxID=162156 RepID=UPI0025FB1443|nr:DcaP family trimeric outer membrane transporter [uncultured Bacteroides sp.]
MKRYILLFLCLTTISGSFAQKQDFKFKFYGQIRTDLYYNSRANQETVDGLFYMYPKDESLDAEGNDLNATPNSNFYTLYSRLGVDVAGPKLGTAKTSAKIEADFRGTGTSYSVVRLRHAYLNLDWGKSALLLGQTWHPLYGEVAPQILNLSMGAPFQPFSRAPQIRYRYNNRHFQLTGAALWQSQYLSQGPAGKSQEYIKKSCVPEVYIGADYKNNGFLAGVGIEMLSMKPRTESVGENNKKYKVDERITTLSYEAHVKYTNKNWYVGAKSVLGSNLTQASGLGGFGIKSINEQTGEQKYTPIRISSSWLNVVYGRKWKPGIFVGYAKNLGTSDDLASPQLYGTGTNLDKLAMAGAELTYNVPHWKFGLEYTLSSAWYGSVQLIDGKITDTHSVRNNRIVAVAMFMF